MARNPMQNQGRRVFRCQQLVVTLDRTGISGVKQLLEHFTAIEQHVSGCFLMHKWRFIMVPASE